MRDIVVELNWSDELALSVEDLGSRVVVRAHPGLSDAQVSAACAELGSLGPGVLAAWRSSVGL
jgi:hypothetical protein